MTYVDYAAATIVTDQLWGTGHLVFKQDVSHPGFPRLPLAERHGFIAYEFIDDNGERQFERLSPDMTFAESEKVVDPYPTGFGSDGTVALSEIAGHIAAAVQKSDPGNVVP